VLAPTHHSFAFQPGCFPPLLLTRTAGKSQLLTFKGIYNEKLAGTSRRAIGRVNDVVTEVLQAPKLCADLFTGLANVVAALHQQSGDARSRLQAVSKIECGLTTLPTKNRSPNTKIWIRMKFLARSDIGPIHLSQRPSMVYPEH
jgi:hypothetical protein